MRNNRDLGVISLLKTICMFLVVLGHACAIYRGKWVVFTPDNQCHYIGFINFWLSTFHVQTFTFASGYLFYFLRYEKNKYRNLQKDIFKRSRRLLVPYAIWSIYAIIFDCIFMNIVN